MCPGSLEILASTLNEAPDAGFAFGDIEYITAQGAPYLLLPGRPFSLDEMFWRNTVTTQSVCIRRSVLEAVGGYRTGVTNADWDLYLRVGARYPSIYIHRVLARYRVHPQSHGLTHLEDFVDSTLTVANSALRVRYTVGWLRNDVL